MHCTPCGLVSGVKSASTQHDDERKERDKRRKHAGKAFIGYGLAYFQATKLQHDSKKEHDEATDCVDESQGRRRGFGRGRCCDGSDIGFVGIEHSSLDHRFQFLSALLHVSCYCKFIDTGASLHHAHARRHSKV